MPTLPIVEHVDAIDGPEFVDLVGVSDRLAGLAGDGNAQGAAAP